MSSDFVEIHFIDWLDFEKVERKKQNGNQAKKLIFVETTFRQCMRKMILFFPLHFS